MEEGIEKYRVKKARYGQTGGAKKIEERKKEENGSDSRSKLVERPQSKDRNLLSLLFRLSLNIPPPLPYVRSHRACEE